MISFDSLMTHSLCLYKIFSGKRKTEIFSIFQVPLRRKRKSMATGSRHFCFSSKVYH